MAFECVLRLDPGNAARQGAPGRGRAPDRRGALRALVPQPAARPHLLRAPRPGGRRTTVAEAAGRTAPWRGWPRTTAASPASSSGSGGVLIAEQRPAPALDAAASARLLGFQREFPLEPGPNELVVTAFDDAGASCRTPDLRDHAPAALLREPALPALRLRGRGRAGRAWASALQRARRRRACAAASTPTSRAPPSWGTTCSSGARSSLARILNVLHHNSLMITGERRIGKTTFLYHLKKVLDADEGRRVPLLPRLHRPAGRPRGRRSSTPSWPTWWRRSRLSRATRSALRFRPDVEQLRRPRLQPRPAARDRGAEDAHRRGRSSSPCSSTRWTCSTSTRSASTSACAASS